MKKLFQINTVINSGSTGRIAEEIGQMAMDNGWESYIAYGRNDRSSNSHKIKIGNDWDIRLHALQTRIFDSHGFGSKKTTELLVEEIERIKPDIIHLHNLHGYYLNIEVLFHYLAKMNIPVVWTLHDCWAFTGHCTHFMYSNCNKWQVQCENCPEKKSYPSSYCMDRSFKNYKHKKELFTSVSNITLVPVSRWLSSTLEKSYLKEFKKQEIYNGIDISTFSPKSVTKSEEKYGLFGKFIILGVVSTWSDRKGLKDFMLLADSLMEGEVIVLVGLTKKIIAGLPANIIGIERTENVEQLAELYSRADVFLNPTWEDNFPTTNIEALACGTPVITYNTGGSPEAITQETGFVISKGNLDELREKLDLIKKKGKSFYSEACRKRAVDNFNKNERYQEYIDLYQSLTV